MEEWAILVVIDADAGEMVVYNSGTKEDMTKEFEDMVVDGAEDADFYLVKVVQSAEHIINVKNHGEE